MSRSGAVGLLLLLLVACGGDGPSGAFTTLDASTDVASGADADASGVTDAPAPKPECKGSEACDDGYACTRDDRCSAGICRGTPYTCDDGIACTLDRCDGSGGCTAELAPGRFCLIGGQCVPDGALDPTNACRACVTPVSTTQYTANDGASCDDALVCTSGDACRDGVCQGDPKLACDDQNACTTDGCQEGTGCVHAPRTGACEDGDSCTVGDSCTNSACVSGKTVLDCSDGDPCTQDGCTGTGGCTHTVVEAPCDDGNACTAGDLCIEGQCTSGPQTPSCDDQNLCTTDLCLSTFGCVHMHNLEPCDDGDPCSLKDSCSAGLCTHGLVPKACDDGNACTVDFCEPNVGCKVLVQTGPCDDGNACTTDETCKNGACTPKGIQKCNDDNPCTDDTCDIKAGTGCVFKNNALKCEDGDPCTEGDKCSKGACVASLTGCDDKNACTDDFCDPQGAKGCEHTLKTSDLCRLSILITQPLRGATLTGSTNIVVKGKVQSPAFPLESVTLNGVAVQVDAAGQFTLQVKAQHGLNFLEAQATDTQGNVDTASQGFYWSTKFQPMTAPTPKELSASKALYLFLGPPAIDDGDHSKNDLDDLASIFEIIMGSFDIKGLIPSPAFSGGGYKVFLKNLSYGAPKVKLTPVAGGLHLRVTIANLKGDVEADGTCIVCFDVSGTLGIQQISIDADLLVSTDAQGKVQVTMKDPDVVVTGIDLDIDGILGAIFDFLVDFILDQFVPTLENEFKKEIGKAIPDALATALGSFAFNSSFDVGPFFAGGEKVTVTLATGLESIFFSDAGGILRMWGAATAPKKTTKPILGSIVRNGCLTGVPESLTMTKQAPLELALADDLLNQILFSLWWGGGLTFPVPPSLLAGQDLTQYGVTNLKVSLDFLLPPIVSSCNALQDLLLQIGDLKVHASLELFGKPVELDLFASADVYAELTASETGIGLSLGDIHRLTTDVVVTSQGFASAEKVIAGLIGGELVPKLFQQLAGQGLSGFPLPKIDLSGLVAGVPPGTAIAIAPEKLVRILGWTLVAGKIQ